MAPHRKRGAAAPRRMDFSTSGFTNLNGNEIRRKRVESKQQTRKAIRITKRSYYYLKSNLSLSHTGNNTFFIVL